ncbi:MAG: hypothetical protein JSS29_04955 [Proteobacteria bacterium]|nr:hypothetical protein [Pseudomonadota bacterium]
MNRQVTGRFAYGLAGATLVLGAAAHAAAYPRVARGVAAAHDLPPFFGRALAALWLADFTTLVAVGLACLALAWAPRRATPVLTLVLLAIPACTAAWLYAFLGNFVPAHLLAGASLLIAAGAALHRKAA